MMNKTILCIALSSACIVTTTNAVAALPDNALLNFIDGIAGVNSSSDPIVTGGSYFGMDANSNGKITKAERTVLKQNDGIFLGTAQGASGSHGGAPNEAESAGIDMPWGFFSNTGMHLISSPSNLLSAAGINATIDFSGWGVTWNSIPIINMGGGLQDCGTASDGICVKNNFDAGGNITGTTDIGGEFDNGTGTANVVCAVDCAVGDTYTLNYDAVVPQADPSNFGGVSYTLHLEGVVGLQAATNTVPVAVGDTATVDRKTTGFPYTPSVIDILANDTDVDSSGDIDRTTVTVDLTGTTGEVVVDPTNGNITYTPLIDTLGVDTFTYTVTDKGGPQGVGFELTSNAATVTINVQNAVPVAVNDSGSINPSSAASVAIDVTDNDTDSDGTIVTTTVNITVPAMNGTTDIDGMTGIVTYTPNGGFIGVDTFQYTVEDNSMAVSNVATAVVTVSSGTGVLPADAFLIINAGSGVPGEGTYFTMEVNPGNLTSVGITGFDHIQLGVAQLASVAMPSIDEPWQFFGNLGVHQTLAVSPDASADITVLTDDSNGNVTLDFSAWNVSWNSIPGIPLNNGDDNGIATMTCAVDCAIGDTFSLIYSAVVPEGDPSNFGGVNYILHMDGTISDVAPSVGGGSVLAPYDVTDIQPIVAVDDSTSAVPNPVLIGPGATATKSGNTTGANLTPEQVGVKDPALNVEDGEQCIGGCIDFIVTGVTTDFIDVVFKLNKPLPDGVIFRKLINGKWGGFSTSAGDQVGSADADVSGNCQGPEGKYNTGLRAGASCVFLRIYDGGVNDADGVKNGTIVDPSGALLAGSSNVPSSSTSGCSISNTKVDIAERADWFIVAGFIVWLGLIGYRRKKVIS